MNLIPKVSSANLVLFAIFHHIAAFLYVIFSVASGIVAMTDYGDDWIIYAVISMILWVPMTVFESLILHRGWAAVQDGQTDVSPGKAVGFGFIPFFSLYWNFVANVGLMRHFNRLAEARGRPDQKVTEGLAITYSVLMASCCFETVARGFRVATIWQTIGAIKEIENAHSGR